jgi:hypothetical protein
MRNTSIVKIREYKGNRFISIPKQISDAITAEYLSVVFADGRLIYSPVSL